MHLLWVLIKYLQKAGRNKNVQYLRFHFSKFFAIKYETRRTVNDARFSSFIFHFKTQSYCLALFLKPFVKLSILLLFFCRTYRFKLNYFQHLYYYNNYIKRDSNYYNFLIKNFHLNEIIKFIEFQSLISL